MITELPVGLKKQDEGDLDWETPLNSGFDAANARLTLSGAGQPNGNVAGHWVGQMYAQVLPASANTVRTWYCVTATGVAATTVWKPYGTFVDNLANVPFWVNSAGISKRFTPGALFASGTFGTGEAVGAVLTDTPVVTINVESYTVGYKILVIATVQINGVNRAAGIKWSWEGGAYAPMGLGVKVPDNKTLTLFATHSPVNPGDYSFKIFSDQAGGLVNASLVALGLGV